MIHWMLDEEGEPVSTTDTIEWAMWFETHNNQVLDECVGRVRISTIFIAVDYNHFDIGAPILWETMIFGGVFHHCQWRYRSRLAALIGHRDAVHLIETYRRIPRRMKKSVRKWQQPTTNHPTRGDVQRVAQFVRRVPAHV